VLSGFLPFNPFRPPSTLFGVSLASMQPLLTPPPAPRPDPTPLAPRAMGASPLHQPDRVVHGAVPPSDCEDAFDRHSELCLNGQITKLGEYAVAGGGCADVWRGSFGTRTVAIKVVRQFASTGRRITHSKLLRVSLYCPSTSNSHQVRAATMA
jgi:hypothetical protein